MRTKLFFKESVFLFLTLFVLAACQENRELIPENVRDIKNSSMDETNGKKLDETLYTGNVDDNLYALDPFTGMKKWSFKAGGEVESSPAVANGMVYFGSYDYKVYALVALTSTPKWAFTTESKVRSDLTSSRKIG